jgi:hypothetical protein
MSSVVAAEINSIASLPGHYITTGHLIASLLFRLDLNNLSVIAGFGGGVVSGLGFVFGVDRGAFVFDISDVTVVVVSSVGHGLDTTVGKGNLVGARNGLTVSGFLGVEVGTRVVIMDTVLESIRLGGFFLVGVGSGGVVGSGSRGVVGGGGGARVHGGATRHDSVGIEILPDVNIALHDGVVGGLMDTARFHTQERGLEEGLRGTEPLIANGDDLAIGKLIGLLQGSGSSSSGHFLLKVKGNIAKLFLDVPDNFTLSSGSKRVTPLSEDLHEVIG